MHIWGITCDVPSPLADETFVPVLLPTGIWLLLVDAGSVAEAGAAAIGLFWDDDARTFSLNSCSSAPIVSGGIDIVTKDLFTCTESSRYSLNAMGRITINPIISFYVWALLFTFGMRWEKKVGRRARMAAVSRLNFICVIFTHTIYFVVFGCIQVLPPFSFARRFERKTTVRT